MEFSTKCISSLSFEYKEAYLEKKFTRVTKIIVNPTPSNTKTPTQSFFFNIKIKIVIPECNY